MVAFQLAFWCLLAGGVVWRDHPQGWVFWLGAIGSTVLAWHAGILYTP